MRKLIILSLASVFTFSGCTTLPVSDAQTTVSDFDGTKTVAIEPHTLNCKDMITCITTGFVWDTKIPEEASMMVVIRESGTGEYHPITSFKFNIDGEIVALESYSSGSTDLDHSTIGTLTTTESKKLFKVPLSLLNKIKNSNNTKFQVVAKGVMDEGDFKNSGESTRAYHAMLKFLEQVETAK